MTREVTSDGAGALQIHFPYDRRLVDAVKTLPRSRYHGAAGRYWSVPADSVVAVVDLLHPEGFAFCEVTRRLYRERGGTLTLEEGSIDKPPAQANAATDFTVSRLNAAAQAALRAALRASVWLVGEVADFDKSAHREFVSFKLVERDPQQKVTSEIRVVLFPRERAAIEERLAAAGDPFRLQDEIQIRVRGRVDLYVPWGQYRVLIDDLDVGYTLGEAARRREEIRRRLAEEGLLEQNRSLPFPVLPLRVGLVTSLESDASRDVLRTLEESGFAFRVVVHGARVQGRSTEPSILNALDWFRERAADFDVLLICRGGGSRTDLMSFDTEPIARAVATFPIPVVIGIGHTQDISVLDFVGWRTKTPTAAARLLVDRVQTAMNEIDERLLAVLDRSRQILRSASSDLTHRAARVSRGATSAMESNAAHLREAVHRLRRGVRRDIAQASRRIDDLATRLGPRSARELALEAERLDDRQRRLHLLDPQRVLARGYALLYLPTGKVLTDAHHAPRGTVVTAELRQGVLQLRSEGKGKR
jgi:exodeoxyribonuclease VII large subunit